MVIELVDTLIASLAVLGALVHTALADVAEVLVLAVIKLLSVCFQGLLLTHNWILCVNASRYIP
jgi:hypothetical protein